MPTEEDLAKETHITEELVDDFLRVFGEAVRARVTTLPEKEPDADPDQSRLGILFSGGIDSMMMAALADKYVPKDEPIDLFNVAFANTEPKEGSPSTSSKPKKGKETNPTKASSPFNVPDRQTGIAGLQELRY